MNDGGDTAADLVKENLTQATYRETPYEDASWKVIGESPGEEIFVPMSFNVIPQSHIMVDPMFADFGGSAETGIEQRWHLPQGVTSSHDPGLRDPKEVIIPQVSMTEEELQRLLEEARTVAREEGRTEAADQFAKRLQEMEQRLNTVLQDLLKQIRGEILRIEREALDLVVNISDRIIGYAVELNPEYIVGLIQEAISLAGVATIYRIRVGSDDMEFVRLIGIQENLQTSGGSWSFEEDSTIRSGCVVDTSAGEVDFQIDKAWERVKDQVLKVKS